MKKYILFSTVLLMVCISLQAQKAEGPKLAIATNIFNPLLMKSIPVCLYYRTGNVVHMGRYAAFHDYKTETFYDVLQVNSGGNVPSKQKNLAISAKKGTEFGYSACFLIKHDGKLLDSDETGWVSDYFGLNFNNSDWTLASEPFDMYVKNTSSQFTQNLSGKVNIKSYRLSYGIMMMKRSIFFDLNFQMGLRSKKLNFDQNLPGTSTNVNFETVDFITPYLQKKDWESSKMYASLMGFLRFGLAF